MKRRRISFFTVEQFEASRALGFPMVDHAFDSEEAERLRGRLAFIPCRKRSTRSTTPSRSFPGMSRGARRDVVR
jgi:hypothetical protein